jgi:hypothetical protein
MAASLEGIEPESGVTSILKYPVASVTPVTVKIIGASVSESAESKTSVPLSVEVESSHVLYHACWSIPPLDSSSI